MPVIVVKDLVKRFKCYASPADRLKEILFKKPRHRVFTALDHVSLTLEKGQSIGVIGQNGSGKSTLLKILAGVLLPDAGTVAIHGRVTGLLELGTGFHGEFTGRENVRHNASLLGLGRDEIEEKMAAVEAFAELGPFIDEPLKIYSSGMVLRLAFSVAIHADPEVFIIDEALAVGDAYFQQKCTERLRAFRQRGGSLLFVSHDMTSVKLLCDQVLVLDKGKPVGFGDPEAMVRLYNRLLAAKGGAIGDERVMERQKIGALGYGSMEVRIRDVRLCLGEGGFADASWPSLGKAGGEGVDFSTEAALAGNDAAQWPCPEATVIPSGHPVTVHVSLEAHATVDELTVGVMIRDRFGQDIFGTNTYLMGERLRLEAGERLHVQFMVAQWNLGPGPYTLTVAAHRSSAHIHGCYHWIDHAVSFHVVQGGGYEFAGVARLPVELAIRRW
uniref:ABC transporter ATP-binding protein n=1 Tax=Desulfacinum infernum TaxID=35837 RepID=A0A831ZTW2_9BACT